MLLGDTAISRLGSLGCALGSSGGSDPLVFYPNWIALALVFFWIWRRRPAFPPVVRRERD